MPERYPLHWPEDMPRTGKPERAMFRCSLSSGAVDVEDALRLFGEDSRHPVTAIVISSNVTIGRERPDDPGVAVYFRWCGADHCIAVDRYNSPAANLRGIYHIIEARRTELRHGGIAIARAALQGFLALPPVDSWRDVLGVGRNGGIGDAEAAYRQKALDHHPDRGGSHDAMARINGAIAAARRELGGEAMA